MKEKYMDDCKETADFMHGDCCCNCAKRIQANKHPMNTIAKGSMSEKFSYVCMETFEDNSGTPTIMEWEHWGCELHDRKLKNQKQSGV